MLKRFIFLDKNTLEDYYCSIVEEANSQVNSIKKFNEIYNYLEENKEINRGFEKDDMLEVLKVGDIIEVNVNIKIPKMYMQIKQITKMAPNIENAYSLGLLEMKTAEDISILNVLRGINGIVQNQDVPVICDGVEKSQGLIIISYLDEKFLRGDLKELNSNVTILGKIKTVINKSESMYVYNLLPDMEKIMDAKQKSIFGQECSDFIEKINGPAVEIYTLAIYR